MMLTPRCTFGIITDVHYADIDDGYNFSKTRRRYYRGSFEHAVAVSDEWAANYVQFALQLGDLIDGRNNTLAGKSDKALEKILSALTRHSLYHVWGNHDLYNYTRAQLFDSCLDSTRQTGVNTPFPGRSAYYTFSPVPGFRLVAIDTFAISVLGHDRESSVYAQAAQFLRDKNHNDDWNSSDGLQGSDVCCVKFNGAVGAEQLRWLEMVLTSAETQQERVIVMGHTPVLADSCDPTCLCWDHKAVLSTFHRHAGIVVAYFCGHDHTGGQATDSAGVHHVTFPGVVEVLPGQRAGVMVRVYDDKIAVTTGGQLGNVEIAL